ncbi:MAG: type III-A CRISPR-associated RAMP protein Csm4, partial [Stellaceae bacterium]
MDRVYHSDTLYSAVSGAMARLGLLAGWLDATARGVPQVRFSSCFPFQGETLYVAPPRSLWPPPPSAKVRWKGARFVPLAVVERLVAERPLEEDRWRVDGLSECLLASGKNGASSGPVRVSVRSSAAVDRLGAGVAAHSTACLEFAPGCGLWTIAAFLNGESRARWGDPLKAALRLLADSGFGGERSRGWGRAEMPEIAEGPLPDLLLKTAAPPADSPVETAYWFLSLFSPAGEDKVDWQRGSYSVVARSGRVESAAGSGERKKVTRMVEEGSVLLAARPPLGTARDVAPAGFPHPVFRSGCAVAIPIPWRIASRS